MRAAGSVRAWMPGHACLARVLPCWRRRKNPPQLARPCLATAAGGPDGICGRGAGGDRVCVHSHRNETTKYRAIKMWRNTKYARKGSMRIHRHNLQVRKLRALSMQQRARLCLFLSLSLCRATSVLSAPCVAKSVSTACLADEEGGGRGRFRGGCG